MPSTPTTFECLWCSAHRLCNRQEASLHDVVTLLVDIRRWCDRHDESYGAIDYIGHEAYTRDMLSSLRRQP